MSELFLNSNAENSVKSIKSSWIHSATDSELSSCYFYERVEECENYINLKDPLLGSHTQWEKASGRGRWGPKVNSEVYLFPDKNPFILSNREKPKMKFYLLGVSSAFVVQSNEDCP